MKLLVGLGNPGAKYARNRHNVGFMALDRLARHHRLPAWRRRFDGEVTEGNVGGERALLLKPSTFMNDSGRAVGEAVRFYKITLGDVVVLHDEIDLAPGKVKVKVGGGNAGHNGLRSISQHLGNDYARVRLGVGHPGVKELVHGWVLSDFAKADAVWLEPLLDAVADAAPRLVAGEMERFLTDVALSLSPVEPGKRGGGQTPGRDDPAQSRPTGQGSDPHSRPHPAGERAGKRQSALAENLRRWLSGRSKGG